MFNASSALEGNAPAPSVQDISQTQKKKGFGKKLYLIIAAIVAVAVIVIALLVPPGAATIPLNVDYVVGEKMVYDSSVTATIESANSALSPFLGGEGLNDTTFSVIGKQTIEVVAFDGEFYTLNHTTTMTLLDTPASISMLERMNKTGYSTYMFNFGNTELDASQMGTGSYYLIQLLNKPEVKVGDSVSVPFPDMASNLGVTGSITLTFKGIQDLQVPAGTYKVFRIDMTADNIELNLNASAGIGLGVNLSSKMNMEMTSQIYMEYGTMRQIKSSMQESMSYESNLVNYTIAMSMNTVLSQHTKP